jgi:protein-L-isoaspartate(D-aspartate) O-methyltransferase
MIHLMAASSLNQMLQGLRAGGALRTPAVVNAMRLIDRAEFSRDPAVAYLDRPLPIGHGVTISAPHMHAMALEFLAPILSEGDRVLDIGSGSGYLSACLAQFVGKTGKVIGIDVIPELIEWSKENVKKSHKDLLDEGRVELKLGDGWKGEPASAPFKAIHVGAAAATLPQELLNQLAKGGRMLIPVGAQGEVQHFLCVDKREDGTIQTESLADVVYVPLVKT